MKKKGFTLIELLAVIVILTIIALISVPIIVGLIERTRKEAFKNTAYGIIGATNNSYASELLKSDTMEAVTFTYTNGVETSSIDGKKLEYNGKKPESGKVTINEDGKVALAIYNGRYCVEKDYDESEVILSEVTEKECLKSLAQLEEIVNVQMDTKLGEGFIMFDKYYQFPGTLNLVVGETYKVTLTTTDGEEFIYDELISANNVYDVWGGFDGGSTSGGLEYIPIAEETYSNDFILDKGKRIGEVNEILVEKYIAENPDEPFLYFIEETLKSLRNIKNNGESWLFIMSELSGTNYLQLKSIKIEKY